MKQEVLSGQTDYTVLVLIRDTAGAPKTGLTEASIDIAYARVETDNDVTTADVTPAALTALTDAHTDWGFEEVSATDHPGLYRLDLADAVFATGAWSAVVTIVGTGLDPTSIEFVMVPNAPLTGVLLAPTTHTSAVIPTVTTTGTATAVTTVNGLAAGVITAAAIANGAIDAATYAADVDAEVRSWLGLAAADLDTQLDAIDAKTTNLPSDPADASVIAGRFDTLDASVADLPTNAELATALGTADDAVLAAIAALNDFDPATEEVLANVQKINDVEIIGDGSGTPFNVA